MEKPKKMKLKLDWKALMMIGSQKSITDTRAEPRHLSNDLSGMSLRSESIDGVVTFWDVTGMEHPDGRRAVRLTSRPHLAENDTSNSQYIEVDVDGFNVIEVEMMVAETGGEGPLFRPIKAPTSAASQKKIDSLQTDLNEMTGKWCDLRTELAKANEMILNLKAQHKADLQPFLEGEIGQLNFKKANDALTKQSAASEDYVAKLKSELHDLKFPVDEKPKTGGKKGKNDVDTNGDKADQGNEREAGTPGPDQADEGTQRPIEAETREVTLADLAAEDSAG